MTTSLYKNWWLLLFKAFVTLIIGLLLVINPQAVATRMIYLTALLFGLSGVAMIAGGYSHRRHNYEWTWWLLEGLIDLLICLVVVVKPLESAYLLALIVGIWVLVMGFIHLATAINIQYYVSSNIIFIITSVLLIVSGVFLIINPVGGLEKLMLFSGICLICYSILQAIISFVLRGVVVEEIDSIKDLY